jgi:putative ABC transport system substrate-binding protein
MRRREFIAGLGGAAACPLAARAQQQSTKIYQLGYLSNPKIPHLIAALRAGLRDLGYVEGQNLTIEYRFAEERAETLDSLAAELVRLRPDAIVTVATAPALAAKRATTSIPIVMATAGDPLRLGVVASLARPGGNITGVTLYGSELAGKRLELLKEAIPNIARVAVLGNPSGPLNESWWRDTQSASRTLGIDVLLFNVKELNELPAEFSSMTRNGVDALDVLSDPLFNEARRQIIGLAAKHRLPAVYEAREFAEAGGLISYGPNIADMTRRSAAFIDKVLHGVKPADLPIEQPTKFELVINLKTAKALGLAVSPTLLARADEVIE